MKRYLLIFLVPAAFILVFMALDTTKQPIIADTALAAKFDYLNANGNSSCSQDFTESIPHMPAGNRIQGSCCSPMNTHRYEEQVEGLTKYKDIPEIPPDPYDIDAALAKKLLAYYDFPLTIKEQEAYDFAMKNSDEKGPCCCMCWHWYVYGGLAKKLIHERGFTGGQIVDVWNLSDGCGGDGDHAHGHDTKTHDAHAVE